MVKHRTDMKINSRRKGDSSEALGRVNFDDARVVAAVEEAAREFNTEKYADRLEQFETTVAEGALSLVIK